MDSSPISGIVQETHEVLPIDSRQFTVDDNELIRYVSQNRERVFSLRYPVHDPTFVLEVLHNGFAKVAILRDNESSTKVWQLIGVMVIGDGRYRVSWTNTATELHHFSA
jgi:hypothetical protein